MSCCGYLVKEEKWLEIAKPVAERIGYLAWTWYLGKLGLLVSEAWVAQSSQLELWVLVALKCQSAPWNLLLRECPQQSLPQDTATNPCALRAVKYPPMLWRATGSPSPVPSHVRNQGVHEAAGATGAFPDHSVPPATREPSHREPVAAPSSYLLLLISKQSQE